MYEIEVHVFILFYVVVLFIQYLELANRRCTVLGGEREVKADNYTISGKTINFFLCAMPLKNSVIKNEGSALLYNKTNKQIQKKI